MGINYFDSSVEIILIRTEKKHLILVHIFDNIEVDYKEGEVDVDNWIDVEVVYDKDIIVIY